MLQTGQLFVDTAVGPAPEYTTTALNPGINSGMQAQYIAGLQQLSLDVSNIASPPTEYAGTCNSPQPELTGMASYLRTAVTDATQQSASLS